ncbi:MAG TPA: hypothetical protein VJ454_10830 [Steroidobacteraceae bacterium]|jgi:hypothetical protein|nr:hypothetical protein [Steroidobacteraceae bacterium]
MLFAGGKLNVKPLGRGARNGRQMTVAFARGLAQRNPPNPRTPVGAIYCANAPYQLNQTTTDADLISFERPGCAHANQIGFSLAALSLTNSPRRPQHRSGSSPNK